MRLTLTDDDGTQIAAIQVTPEEWGDTRMTRPPVGSLLDRLIEARDDYRCQPGERTDPSARCTRHSQHYYCETCQGYYGVPHDTIHTDSRVRGAHPYGTDYRTCACRPCKVETVRRWALALNVDRDQAIKAMMAAAPVSVTHARLLLDTEWSHEERYDQ